MMALPRRGLLKWQAGAVVVAAGLVLAGVVVIEVRGNAGAPDWELVEVSIPLGATSRNIADQLGDAGLVSRPWMFDLYVRVLGRERSLKAGEYGLSASADYRELLDLLHRGVVKTSRLTIPEGLRLDEVAGRLAVFTGDPVADVKAFLWDSARTEEYGVPGPTLEGYLFPETYRFAGGVGIAAIVGELTSRYKEFWGDEERAMAAERGLDEREIVTLASIVEEETGVARERPVIAGVYWNRLQIGMRLQADPTVQYALGAHRARLLYRDIESVADDPYNTYAHAGLPPGPISSPGAAALRAALDPDEHPYLFFVARTDGSHEFTRTLSEHNSAKNRIRREREAENP